MKKVLPIFAALIILAALFSAGADAAPQTVTITFTFPAYTPNDVTISAGDSIQWSGVFAAHPLRQVTGPATDTPVNGGFAYSGSDPTFTVTFNTPGTYYFQCTNHGLAQFGGTMRGSITVQGAAGPTPTPEPTATVGPTPTPCSVKPDAPVLQSPVTGAKSASQSIALAWSAPQCATSYKVSVRRDSKTGVVVRKKTVKVPHYNTGKLDRGHLYLWNVSACDPSGCSPSKTSKFTVKKASRR